jgi:hypothetical protein
MNLAVNVGKEVLAWPFMTPVTEYPEKGEAIP